MMNNSQIFAWDNYEDDPNKAIGIDTVGTQKDGVWSKPAEGEFEGNVMESFFTNNDEMAYPQIAEVIGESPKELVYGKGYVAESDEDAEPKSDNNA